MFLQDAFVKMYYFALELEGRNRLGCSIEPMY